MAATASSPTDTRTSDDLAPRLGLGPLGIAIRALAAIAILALANLATAPVLALVEASPALRGLGSETTWASVSVLALIRTVPCVVVVVLAWAWVRLVERRRMTDIGLRVTGGSPLWLLVGAITAGGLLLLTAALLPDIGPAPTPEQIAASGPFVLVLILAFVTAFIAQGFPEELLFRGMLHAALRSRPVLAVTVTALVFAAIHIVSSGWQETLADHLLFLVMPLGFGLLATGLLLWTRSLWAAVGVHGGMHLANSFAGFLPQTDPALLWVVTGTLYAVLGLALITAALRRGRSIPAGTGEWR